MRPVLVILTVLLILIAGALVSRVQITQAQPSAPITLRHVKSDSRGNMVDADSLLPVSGSVKGLACVTSNDCWVALQ